MWISDDQRPFCNFCCALHFQFWHVCIIPFSIFSDTNEFTCRPTLAEQTQTIVIRDGSEFQDQVEVRRIFIHPRYAYPSLYNDIAVVEFGKTREDSKKMF